MPHIYTVTIPTSPYIKSFVTAIYGNPVAISNKNPLGSFLIGVMTKRAIDVKCIREKKDIRFKFFIDALTCIAPWSQMDNYGYHLTENHIIQINRWLENIFEERLYFYVQSRINQNSRYAGYDKAYEAFINEYNMPENVSVELLKKIEYRFRKKILEKSIPPLSPPKIARQKMLFAS
jgi:hypothetical protein